MESYWESALAIVLGLGLAASCGFRVFVPLLVASAAVHAGYLEVATGFEWLGTWTALVAFAAATLLEIAAYYVPWLDNLLDTIATPMSVAAGATLFAASMVDFGPFWQWSLAIIAGGGSAGMVQGGSVVARLASTTTTGGLANFVFSTLETAAGFLFSVLAIVIPVLTLLLLLLVVGAMFLVGWPVLRRLFGQPERSRP